MARAGGGEAPGDRRPQPPPPAAGGPGTIAADCWIRYWTGCRATYQVPSTLTCEAFMVKEH